MKLVIILLFLSICRMQNYTCNNDTYHKQNANGYVSYSWLSINNTYISAAEGISVISTDHENSSFYYMQNLYNHSEGVNYTSITKFNSIFDVLWEKVYNIGCKFPCEKLLLSEDQKYLYTILYDVDYATQTSNFIIVGFNESNGEINFNFMMNPKAYDIRYLYLDYSKDFDESDTYSLSFLYQDKENSIHWFCQSDSIDSKSINCLTYVDEQPPKYLPYKYQYFWVNFLVKENYEYMTFSLVKNASSTDEITFTKLYIGNYDPESSLSITNVAEDNSEYKIASSFERTLLAIYDAHYNSSSKCFNILFAVLVDFEEQFESINEVTINFNKHRNSTFIFVRQTNSSVSKCAVVEYLAKQATSRKIKIYYYDCISNNLNYDGSYGRWIYKIFHIYNFNRINRVYDQALEYENSVQKTQIISSVHEIHPVVAHRTLSTYPRIAKANFKVQIDEAINIVYGRSPPFYDKIALFLESQTKSNITIDTFLQYPNTLNLNQSCATDGSSITFKQSFNGSSKLPDWLIVDHDSLQDQLLVKISGEHPGDTQTYEIQLQTVYDFKNYNDSIILHLLGCKVPHCTDCNNDTKSEICNDCTQGYELQNSNTECAKKYDPDYAKAAYIMIQVISISITVGFVILFLLRDKIFMHIVVYLENYLLSMVIIGFFYDYYSLQEDLYKIKYGKNDFGYFSVSAPFNPISSWILQIPMNIEYIDSNRFTLSDRFTLRIFLLLISFVLLLVLMIFIIFVLKQCKLFISRIQYTIATKPLKWTLNLLIWFLFCTNAICIEMVSLLCLYIFSDYKISDDIISNRLAFCFSILYCVIFYSIVPYLIASLFKDFAKQIAFGESDFGNFTKKFSEATTMNTISKSFYLIWIIRIYICMIPYISLLEIAKETKLYGILVCAIIWLPILWFTSPFKDKSLNFAAILNHVILCSMYFVFFINALINNENDSLYFNDSMITFFAVGICSLGSFLAISYKITCHIIRLMLFLYPYFKAFYIKTTNTMKAFFRWLRIWSRTNCRNCLICRRCARGTCTVTQRICTGLKNCPRQCIIKTCVGLSNCTRQCFRRDLRICACLRNSQSRRTCRWCQACRNCLRRKNTSLSQERSTNLLNDNSTNQTIEPSDDHKSKSDTGTNSQFQESCESDDYNILKVSHKVNDSDVAE